MFLSNPMILDAVRDGSIIIVTPEGQPVIQPDQLPPPELQAHGYSMRVNKVICLRTGKETQLSEERTYWLRPGEPALLETYERVALSNRIAGTVHSLARLYMCGMSAISTTIHPGWGMPPDEPSPLRVPVVNYLNLPLDITYLDPICRIVFHQTTGESTAPAPSHEEVFARQRTNVEDVRKRYEQRRRRLLLGLTVLLAILVIVVIATLYQWLSAKPQMAGFVGPIVGAVLGAVLATLISFFIRDLRA